MTRLKSILVATDFSADATEAVRKAALLAEHHAARLTLLHVVNPEGFRPLRQWFSPSIDVDLKAAQARATLRRFAAEIAGRHGVPARFRVAVGESFDEIRRASEGVDLVVLGQRGRNPLKDLVTGSTAERLLRCARHAMLVVKQPLKDFYRRILVPVDFTDSSGACLQAAGTLVPRADIQAFHARACSEEFEMRMAGVPAAVIRDHGEVEDRNSRLRMRCMAAEAGIDSHRLATVVRCGPAWACALDQAERSGADLIVVGKQGTSTMADYFLGGTTRRLLAASRCDVLVLPRAAAEALLSQPPVVSRPDRGAASASAQSAAPTFCTTFEETAS